MGCSPSKPSECPNCHAQCSPVRRSYSSISVVTPRRSSYRRSPPPEDDGNHHVVGLTTTTLGYLLLEPSPMHDHERCDPEMTPTVRRNAPENNSEEFTPKKPTGMDFDEPETINAWELMEGLDDLSPLRPPSTADHIHRFSFNSDPNSIPINQPILPSQEKDPPAEVSLKMLLKLTDNGSNSDSNSNDPKTNNLKPLTNELKHESANYTPEDAKKSSEIKKKEKLILYFTTLRGVRKTYEDCCHVRAILKNFGVRVDERDVSMHSGFKEELKVLLGDRYGGSVMLPKVFVGKTCIGGADEIRRFHDESILDKVLEGCAMEDRGGGGDGEGCEACGDIRFLPCETCWGSCKVFFEVDSEDGEKEEAEESDYGFQRCPDCNENGLVRCPICCD